MFVTQGWWKAGCCCKVPAISFLMVGRGEMMLSAKPVQAEHKKSLFCFSP